MTFTIVILLGVIGLLLMSGYYLIHTIEQDRMTNEQYFADLRKRYDDEVLKLKEDIRIRDDIIRAYRNYSVNGSRAS